MPTETACSDSASQAKPRGARATAPARGAARRRLSDAGGDRAVAVAQAAVAAWTPSFPRIPSTRESWPPAGPPLRPTALRPTARTIPITTRHELVRDRLANPPYGTNLTFPLEAYVRCHQTSGTTTVPIRWLDTAESWSHIVDNWVQILRRRRGRPGGTASSLPFPSGRFLGSGRRWTRCSGWAASAFPGGSMSSHARLQAILDNGITAVCCTPTYAQHLGEVAREKKVDLARSRAAPADRGR